VPIALTCGVNRSGSSSAPRPGRGSVRVAL